jgi:hypothetical protein
MKFSELLLRAIQKSEIPLRFEPGAEESVAKPITEILAAWVAAHQPRGDGSEFDAGQQALIERLLAELNDSNDLPE